MTKSQEREPLEVTADVQDGRRVEWYGEICGICHGKLAFIAGFVRHVENGSITCPHILTGGGGDRRHCPSCTRFRDSP